ncbi:uncharacterized protein PGTG_10315 [Puccinia graminis f. sp. tritici CRL 75-36-700-3]|uniref:Uncharacterized protein n=1 Tax=Puccinia graminis f. sp. tritici (strain CRL 75-36-700-3 / race SCCL) TaxID=418459 RepID=E3KKL9_PUCGT|nr:uncharacterized protein PGTG_10315 [Puccinia graminis f. sp. tritici CRL 75-36-700-3]EFP84844.2 hypothetical protein PGTG_10315 [Puccinia graminis f. sp. tritici CRL 75-36-700-3]
MEIEMTQVATVAELVRAFKSNHPDGRSEQEDMEISFKATRQLRQRVSWLMGGLRANQLREDTWGKHSWLRLRNDIPYKLRQVFLPALQESLRNLSLTFERFDPTAPNPSWWYEAFLDNLIDIDDRVEQLDVPMRSIRKTYEPEQGSLGDHPNVEHSTYHRVATAETLLSRFMYEKLEMGLLYQCANFFSGFGMSNPFGGVPSASQKYLYAEWQELIEKFEESFELLRKPIRFKADRYYDSGSESDDEPAMVHGTLGKFVQATVPLIGLARIYFNKLLRSNTSSRLIFVRPSMNIEDTQLKLLLRGSAKIAQHIQRLTYNITRWPTRRRQTVGMLVDIIRGFTQFSTVLEKYWDSLLERNDPLVDREMIEDARHWLNTWTSLFFDISCKAMQATGCKYTWPPRITTEDVDMED